MSRVAVHRQSPRPTIWSCRARQPPVLPGAITAPQNIPVVSWPVLRGKCTNFGHQRALPLVELLTGADVGRRSPAWLIRKPVLAALVLTWFLVALTFIDLDHHAAAGFR